MRTAIAVASVVFATAAVPASAQTTGEQIFRGILQGLLTPQQEQQDQAIRFDVSDVAGAAACTMNFTGTGDTGAVQPQTSCPGALATAASWRRSGGATGDMELRNANNQVVWRGQAHNEGWTGGAADTLRVYSIKPGAAVAAPAEPAFDAATLHGDWRAAEPGQTRGCRVTFVRPDPNNRFAPQNVVRVERGCPAHVGGATQWFHVDGVLTLTDQAGAVQATLTRANADRWTGQSDDVDIILSRL